MKMRNFPFVFYGSIVFSLWVIIFINFPILTALAIFYLVVLFYARFIEPFQVKITKLDFHLAELQRPLRIVFAADLQVGEYKKNSWLAKMADTIVKLNPDLVLLGGDFIANEGNPKNESDILKSLKTITDRVPTYAVLGNHEYGYDYRLRDGRSRALYEDRGEEVAAILKAAGVKLLRNEWCEIQLGDLSLRTYGTDDLWVGKLDWNGLLAIGQAPQLLLTHNPDAILQYPEQLGKPALVLSGHTHAGQVRLPFFGPLGNAQLKLGKQFYHGLQHYKGIPLFITAGLGESGFPIRLFNPPELAVITLKPK